MDLIYVSFIKIPPGFVSQFVPIFKEYFFNDLAWKKNCFTLMHKPSHKTPL